MRFSDYRIVKLFSGQYAVQWKLSDPKRHDDWTYRGTYKTLNEAEHYIENIIAEQEYEPEVIKEYLDPKYANNKS